MRAFQVTSLEGSPSIQTVEKPDPGPGEIRLAVKACGLNFGDLLMMKGQYQERPPMPFTLGMEMAGEVDALGHGVNGIKPGQRVAAFTGMGGLADYATLPADRLFPIPDQMPYVDAAAFMVAYGTSHLALAHRARLQPGERLLVLGAAGGVGLTAVELGKAMGAEVIACARGADKLEICRKAGADHVIDSGTGDIRDAVKALGGSDVVYDPVGGDQFMSALRATNREGRVIVIGFASGDVPQVPANLLLVKNITLIGYYWGGYMAFAPDKLIDSLKTLIGWYVDGRIKPYVSHILPLEQAGDAYELLRSRKSTGKVVVTP